MHIHSLSKRFLAGIFLFSQLLTSCLGPNLDPDQSSPEPVEEPTNSHSSSIVATTKQEDKAQELALQTSTQEKAKVAADKQTLDLQTVEEDCSNKQMDIKEQEHVVNHQTKIIQGLEAKKELVNDQTTSTNTVSKTIIFNQENFNEGKENKKIQTSDLIALSLGELRRVSIDILKTIFSYVGSKHMGKVRQVNKALYKLTTGYEMPGIVGVAHKPQANMLKNVLAINNKVVNFRKIKGISPETIPSFPWYQLVGEVQHLPQGFWPYIAGTQVHTLYLQNNDIGAEGAKKLAAALPSTQVHNLHLVDNPIGTEGVKKLAAALPSTQICTLQLGINEIFAKGAKELAAALPSTQIHTLYLESNQIGNQGVKELAAALPSTQIRNLYLGWNQIGDEGVKELSAALPSTQVHILHLNSNHIGKEGAKKLAADLPSTQVHTLYLRGNQIGTGMKILLRQKNPHITFQF